ncbi:glycosyltransferase [Streptomyces sp. NPDC054770]
MRILFSMMPAGGHFRPLVPIAEAALRAGHQVAVCTPASAKAQVDAYRLEHLPAGHDWVSDEIASVAHETSVPSDHGERLTLHLAAEGYPGPEAVRTARDILAHDWRPDVIVRENTEFGGYLAAEVLGVPHVSVGAVGASTTYLDVALSAPALDRGRAELGLPSDPDGRRVYAYLHAYLMPASFDPDELSIPNARCYQQTSPRLPGERLPDWVAELPAPPVFAAFGTMHPRTAAWHPATAAVAAGLGMLDRPGVVASGGASVGTPPPSVRVVDWISQPLMLECASVFVHHGGFNSVREGLRAGVPMVVIPWFTDSVANAERCVEAGVAVSVPYEQVTPEAIRSACAEVLDNPSYKQAAEAMRRRILCLPSVDDLVADIAAISR